MIAPLSTLAGVGLFGHNFAPVLGFVRIVIVNFVFLSVCHTENKLIFQSTCVLVAKNTMTAVGDDDVFTVRNLLTIY